jgi:hypothetical protein
MTKRRLGELLQAEGLISEEQCRAALEEQRKSNLFLGEALVKLGFVSEEAIAQTIVAQFSLPFMSAIQCTISPDVLNTFPERMYYEYQFIAVDKIARVLIIIGAGLMNHDVLDELERLSGCKVCQYVSTWKDIKAALERYAKELKKEQNDGLTSLGSMLLDATPLPSALPKLPDAKQVTSAAPPGQAAAHTAPKPVAAPSPLAAAASAARTTTVAPGMKPPVSTPGSAAHPGPQTVRLSALAGMRPPVKAPTSQAHLPAVKDGPGGKPSTNAPGIAPPGNGADGPKPPSSPVVKDAAPPAEAGKSNTQGPKPGLLGLFKKQ